MSNLNITVKTKLFATLALAGVVMVAVGVLGLSGTKSSNGHLDALFSNRFEPTGWVGAIEAHEREVLEKAEDAVIRQDPAGVRVAIGMLADRATKVQELLRKLLATDLTEKERALVNEFAGHGNDVISSLQESLLAAQAGTFDRAESALIERARPTYDKLNASGDALLELQIKVGQQMRIDAEKAFKRNSAIIVGAIAIGLGLAALLSFLLAALDPRRAVSGREHRGPHRERRAGQQREASRARTSSAACSTRCGGWTPSWSRSSATCAAVPMQSARPRDSCRTVMTICRSGRRNRRRRSKRPHPAWRR